MFLINLEKFLKKNIKRKLSGLWSFQNIYTHIYTHTNTLPFTKRKRKHTKKVPSFFKVLSWRHFFVSFIVIWKFLKKIKKFLLKTSTSKKKKKKIKKKNYKNFCCLKTSATKRTENGQKDEYGQKSFANVQEPKQQQKQQK